MKTTLEKELKRLEGIKKPTLTDERQFLKNVEAKYKIGILQGHTNLLYTHLLYIDKEVYRFVNNFRYTDDLDSGDVLNKINPTPVKFTKSMYSDFQLKLIDFFIEKITTELLEHDLFSRSTNQVSNVKNEVIIESKQDLLKLYKQLRKTI